MNKYDAGSIDILLERVASLGKQMEASENVQSQLESKRASFKGVIETNETANKNFVFGNYEMTGRAAEKRPTDEVLKIALTKEFKKVEWTEIDNVSKTKTEDKSQAIIQ